MTPKYEVGQVVWVVMTSGWRVGGAPREMEVTKVGRKWVELNNGRYRLEQGERRLDGRSGYGSPGTVYLTRSEWASERIFDHTFYQLQKAVYEMRSTGLTLQDIRDAAKALRITLPEWQDPEAEQQQKGSDELAND